jgi:5-methylcytosine-specific restriction endonuclease McrA
MATSLGNNWSKISKRLRAEQPWCACCLSTEYLVVHHKDKDHDNNTRHNLRVLCTDCHAKFHPELPQKGFQLFKKFIHESKQKREALLQGKIP